MEKILIFEENYVCVKWKNNVKPKFFYIKMNKNEMKQHINIKDL